MYDVSRFTTTHVATSDAIFCQKIVAFHAGLRFFFPLPTSAVLSESIVYIYMYTYEYSTGEHTPTRTRAQGSALRSHCPMLQKRKVFFSCFLFFFFSNVFPCSPACPPPSTARRIMVVSWESNGGNDDVVRRPPLPLPRPPLPWQNQKMEKESTIQYENQTKPAAKLLRIVT